MPRGDRTGPNGMGSRTGRGAGFCSGNNEPGFTTAGGRGGGMGRRGGGRGAGFGRGMNQGAWQGAGQGWNQGSGNESPAMVKNNNTDLSRRAEELEEQIAQIKQQLNERS